MSNDFEQLEYGTEIIKEYQGFKEKINNPQNVVGFATKNGKRIVASITNSILTADFKYFALSKHLKMVGEAKELKFSKSRFDLIMSYFDETIGSVRIDKICIFKEMKNALEWLLED